jgi:hypothetical protein
MKHALVFMLAATGCAPFVPVLDLAKVPRAERATAATVVAYPLGARPTSPLTYVGRVQATSCKFLLWDAPASTGDAIEQVKVKAHRAGADSVVDVTCDDLGASLETNCWSSITCSGIAVNVAR